MEAQYETLMKMNGADPWKAGPMKMAHWVLVPETFSLKAGRLKEVGSPRARVVYWIA